MKSGTHPWPPRLSLRARVTWMVVGVSAMVQLVLAAGVYLYFRSVINGFFDDRLSGRLRVALADVGRSTRPEDHATLMAATEQTLRMAMFTSLVLVVRDEQGRVLGTSTYDVDLEQLPPVPRRPSRVQSSTSSIIRSSPSETSWPPSSDFVTMRGIGLEPPLPQAARVMTAPFTAADGRSLLLTAAVSNAAAASMIEILGRAVVFASAVGLMATGLASWLVTGVALSPLSQIGTLAQRLGIDGIPQIPLPLSASVSAVPEFDELTAELEQARDRIRASLAANERFIVNVSHEIKTPVAVLRAQAQTLPIEDAPPAVQAFVRSVDEEAARLGSMVDSFLTLASVRSGQSLSTMTPVYVHDLVLDAIRRSAPAAQSGQVSLRPGLNDQAEELTVSGNADLLCVMIDNLVRNAVRFSPATGVVDVSVAHDPHRVTITVADQGPGIPAELLPKLFDRFSQASTEVGRGRGHGLGLSIAQGIAELHGGTIDVTNLSPRGCRFEVRLPRTGSATFDTPLAGRDRPGRTPEPPAYTGPR